MRKLLLLLVFIILYSLNDKKSGAVNTPFISTKSDHPQTSILPPPVYIDSAATEQQILAHLAQRKKDIENLLKTRTPQQADKWYEDYKKEDDSTIFVLMQRDTKLLEL